MGEEGRPVSRTRLGKRAQKDDLCPRPGNLETPGGFKSVQPAVHEDADDVRATKSAGRLGILANRRMPFDKLRTFDSLLR